MTDTNTDTYHPTDTYLPLDFDHSDPFRGPAARLPADVDGANRVGRSVALYRSALGLSLADPAPFTWQLIHAEAPGHVLQLELAEPSHLRLAWECFGVGPATWRRWREADSLPRGMGLAVALASVGAELQTRGLVALSGALHTHWTTILPEADRAAAMDWVRLRAAGLSPLSATLAVQVANLVRQNPQECGDAL